ncbi:YdeI/OmpD-associated family protein [Demequina sp.]|uniref:YdeI/OmpD-associated family protein n=1 Tax=Demequina sp. TaxID=2050685 RepID=UPI003D0CF1CF
MRTQVAVASGRMGDSQTYTTTIEGIGNNAGIPVPAEVLEALGAGKRPGVHINVNGYEYQNTVGIMGGHALLPLAAAHRKASGLAAGDDVTVTLTVADAPRAVDMPEDFAAALDAAGIRGFFDGLSNSLQRMHVGLVTDAKAPETRARRIEKAVGLFAEGKQR